MHKLLFLIILPACLLVSACTSANINRNADLDLNRKYRVAVIEAPNGKQDKFWTIVVAGTYRVQNARPTLQYLEDELIKSGKFEVVERNQLKHLLDEQALSLSGFIEEGNYTEIGKLASLDGIIVITQGTADVFWIFPFEFFETSISAKFINPTSGRLIWTGDSQYSVCTIIPFIPLWINHEKTMIKSLVAKLNDK